jgi:hypothetical protein
MSKQGTQGQSVATLDKERCIASALSIGMKIANRAYSGRGYRYWHLDCNSGSGWNDDVDVPGSPLVFHRAADEYLTGMKREAFFCDIDFDRLKILKNRISNQCSSYCLPGDNEEAIQVFAERIRSSDNPRYAAGSVIVDPNGYWYRNSRGEGPPVNALTEFSKEFERIDIILNLNATAYKRQVGAGFEMIAPRDVLFSLNRSHWLVRRTICRGSDFLLAVGRNLKTGSHPALGFHHIDSDEGRFIMLKAEGKRQGVMTFNEPIQDLFGISQASGF